ncbi:GNAT family N-acetyltransferase [Wukongibacter baidiensis]|uniref:GNAT family N-acetyltransferase n=1 Tax=Wukongibacter baidiensis TaxID=1723361 RepID=UPI003D7F4ED5
MKWEIKKFRELKLEELYEILKIRNTVFVIEQECIYQDVDDKDKEAYHLFAMEDDKVVAYLRILGRGISYNEASIGRVLIDNNYRGKGLARELMLKAISFVESDLNEDTIRISAQEYLINFYGSLGFKAVSDMYLEDDIPHVEMLYKKK